MFCAIAVLLVMAISSSSKMFGILRNLCLFDFYGVFQALTMVLLKVWNRNQSDIIHDLPTAECSQRTVDWLSGRAASWLLFKLSILIPISACAAVGRLSLTLEQTGKCVYTVSKCFYLQSLSMKSLVFVLVSNGPFSWCLIGCFVQTESRKDE